MAILVQELRLSLVWSKVYAKDANLPSLADPNAYQSAFEGARQSGSAPSPWQLPWITGYSHRFWQFYLKEKAPGNFQQITARDARSFFVPLRMPPCCHISAAGGATVTLEGYCYPHSASVIGTVRLRPDKAMPLDQMVDAAMAARDADYNLRWHDAKSSATHGPLKSLADKVVTRVHQLAAIDAHEIGVPLPPPITTAAVIQAEGSEPDDDATLRALHGLCWLRPGWKQDQLVAEMPDPNVLSGIAIGRGRAIWLPLNFSPQQQGHLVSLGCYHRNLTIAAMQSAALAALAGRAEEIFADPNGRLISLSPAEVGRAIQLLDRLSSKNAQAVPPDSFTYRSWTAQYQGSFYQERIQRVRKNLGS